VQHEWFDTAGGRDGLAERLTWRGFAPRSLAGVVSGLFAGACMMVFAVLYTGLSGRGWWLMPKLFAATFLGVGALVGGAGAVVLGLVIHAVVSVLWGIFFAFCVSRSTTVWYAMGWGVFHGFFVWMTMTWTVLPWADPTLYPRLAFTGGPWLAAHVVYGAASFAVVPALRWFPRRRPAPSVSPA
jgi:hypothetical protein